MRVVNKNEARIFVDGNPEATMRIEVFSDRYICILSCIETREENDEDYPEGLCLNFYGDGDGWSIIKDEFLALPGNTLNDKLVSEQGRRCGDIYLGGENVIDRYISGEGMDDTVFLKGTDVEFQQMLPYLSLGTYCFLFEDEAAVRKRMYREQEKMYRRKDAENAIKEYIDFKEESKEVEKRLLDDVDCIVEKFNDMYDCNTGENYIWEAAIEHYLTESKEKTN